MTVEKDKFMPVNRLPNDPENGMMSKADVKKKWAKQKALQEKMRAYETKIKAELMIEEEENAQEVVVEKPAVQEVKEVKEVKAEKPVKAKK